MGERYRPLFKLDSGGMAEVYVAEAESMAGFKKKVAIKRILPGLIKDQRFVRMFLDEARLSLHLNHANIVTVFDIGKSDSAYFIVMEYVAGTNLKSIIEHRARLSQPVPIALTVWILNEILKGLDYAHRLMDPETGEPLGIVHRDISPPNILISWNGEVKLTDFGLAKATTQLESTDPGVVKGKFAYLSPEAAHGQPVDLRTDIFAVGILAFEMLTGHRLFLGENDYKTVERVRAADVPDLIALNPEIPTQLRDIVMKSLTRDPNDRYQTANEFAEELVGFLFSYGVKVSARDMTAVVGELRDVAQTVQKTPSGGNNLIMSLIDDELLKFKSLGDDDDEDEAGRTGSRPLVLDGIVDEAVAAKDYDPSAPLVDAFDMAPPPPGSPPPGSPPPGSLPGMAPTSVPPEPPSVPPGIQLPHTSGTHMPSPTPKRESNATALVVVLLLALAGGGAYYWLVVMGNLDKLAQ